MSFKPPNPPPNPPSPAFPPAQPRPSSQTNPPAPSPFASDSPFGVRPRSGAGSRSRSAFLPEPSAGEQDFDALTDLFLGELGHRASAHIASTDARADATTDRPRLRLRRDTEDDPSFPLPDLAPMPALSTRTGDAMAAADVALPDAVITNEEIPAFGPETSDRQTTSAANDDRPIAAAAIVECIILGHLPVLGSAWATQYVREVAQAAQRPVAVLRVQAGYVSVEVVGAIDGDTRRATAACRSAVEAVRTAQSITDRWILRCDAAEEAAVAARPAVRVITLLTGGDEAARVGAYASIKSLAEHIPPPTPDNPGALVRLAIMGAPDEAGQAAGSRVAETVRTFLQRDIEQVVCSSRIGSSRSPLLLFSGPAEGEPARIFDLLERSEVREDIAATVIEPVEAPPLSTPFVPERRSNPTVVAPELPRQVLVPADESTLSDEFADEPAESPEPIVAEATAEHTSRLAPAMVEEPAVLAAPAEARERLETVIPENHPEPAPTARIIEAKPALPECLTIAQEPVQPTLEQKPAEPISQPAAAAPAIPQPAAHLATHIAGLRPLPVQCPYAESVELAVDESAALHLLVRAEGGGGEASDEAVLAALFVASSWAEAHATLLALAMGTPVVSSGRPVLHLFTDRPKNSRRLLETNVRIHLLAPISVGDRTGWFCTDLN